MESTLEQKTYTVELTEKRKVEAEAAKKKAAAKKKTTETTKS